MNVSTISGKANRNGGMPRKNGNRCYSSWWAHLKLDCRKNATMQEKVEFFRPIFKPRSKPVTFRTGKPDAVIYIPSMMAAQEFSKYKMSARLRNVLGFNRYWLLGDLDGVAYDDLLQLRNCGEVSVAELKRLVKRIRNEARFLTSQPAVTGLAHGHHDGGGFGGAEAVWTGCRKSKAKG